MLKDGQKKYIALAVDDKGLTIDLNDGDYIDTLTEAKSLVEPYRRGHIKEYSRLNGEFGVYAIFVWNHSNWTMPNPNNYLNPDIPLYED